MSITQDVLQKYGKKEGDDDTFTETNMNSGFIEQPVIQPPPEYNFEVLNKSHTSQSRPKNIS